MRVAPVLVAIVSFARAADAPATVVSEDEADPIHSAILRGEAWTQDSVRRLRAEADRRMKEGPWSVTFDRPKAAGLDAHEYYSESPFWWPDPINPGGPYIRREAAPNPDRFMANRTALNSLCDAIFTLGSAAFLLDEPRYAQRASRLVQTWFLNPKTRMSPSLDHAQSIPGPPPAPGATAASWGWPALDGRPLIRAVQGMEFLAQAGGWDARD
ncbi:MAG: alginate lyase family protein, partial [Acidobacteriia bacterium]|nr:alginate lyase family protein [Terriglobia bacterium]